MKTLHVIADPPVARLSENTANALRQLRGESDAHWKLAVRVLERELDAAFKRGQPLPRMKLYQDAAALLGQKTSTVRNWVGIYNAVGDELLDEYDGIFTFSHWRALVPAARRANHSVADYAALIAATADDYAGLPIPVDVIVARSAAGQKTPAEIFEDALDSARSDLAVMSRHVAALYPKLRKRLGLVIAELESLAAAVDLANTKRLNQPQKDEAG